MLRRSLALSSTCFNPYRVFSSAETCYGGRWLYHRHVSIPIGFSHQLRPRPCGTLVYPFACFNPYRVFSSAETGRGLRSVGRESGFNPYRVFSSAETHPVHGSETGTNLFQSLSGFLIRLGLLHVYPRVSIPIGFSHQLRPAAGLEGAVKIAVSIPIGFSHQLRPSCSTLSGSRTRFQSLSGFLIS